MVPNTVKANYYVSIFDQLRHQPDFNAKQLIMTPLLSPLRSRHEFIKKEDPSEDEEPNPRFPAEFDFDHVTRGREVILPRDFFVV